MRFIILFFSLLIYQSIHAKKTPLEGDTIKLHIHDHLILDSLKPFFVKMVEPDFSPSIKTYTLQFSLTNNTGYDQQWILDFHKWSYVTLTFKEDSLRREFKTGHLYPFRKRSYQVANKAYILLQFKNQETKTLIVQLESAFNNELRPGSLQFSINPRFFIDQSDKQRGIIIFSFLSIFLVMFFYNLFIYLSTRLKTYALYLLVILLAFYHTAYNSGYLIEIFGRFDSFPVWLTYFERISSTLLGISITLLASEFLKVKQRYPGWYKLIRVIIPAYVVFGLIIFINEPLGMNLSEIVAIATIITIITLAIKSTRSHYPASGYFLVGYSAFFFGSLVLILALENAIRQTDFTMLYAMPIGSAIELILFSFAFANMINVLRHENEQIKSSFQKELLKTQLEIQEATFKSISLEIHDNIGQTLSLIKLNINSIHMEEAEVAKEMLDTSELLLTKVIQDLRDLSKMLNTDYLKRLGLTNAVRQQLQLLTNTGKYTTDLKVTGHVTEYEPTKELVLFRIIQELLNNIVKHAQATTIEVEMDYQQEKLYIKVRDNGKGFNPEALVTTEASKGLGIRNIYHRIGIINGRIEITSGVSGKGLEVKIQVPK